MTIAESIQLNKEQIARAFGVPAHILADPDRTATPRYWSLCMTSENHGTVGKAGDPFSHAPGKHERVLVVEVPTPADAPIDRVDLRVLTGTGVARTPMGELVFGASTQHAVGKTAGETVEVPAQWLRNLAQLRPEAYSHNGLVAVTRAFCNTADDYLAGIPPVCAVAPATTGASPAKIEEWSDEIISLHRQLAAEKLRANQGWGRAEAKSRECINLRERMASSVGASTVRPDWLEYDQVGHILTIYGVKYSGDLFSGLGLGPVGMSFTILAREDGALTLCRGPVAPQAGHVAPVEESVRFCPACGNVGEVGPGYHDCCPDGSEARRIPKPLANKCHELFKVALSAMRAADPAAPAQAAPAPAQIQPPSPTECWSLSDEGFSHDSLGELLDNHPDLVAGARVFVGEAAHPALNRLIDSDDVIDQMGDRADDIAGEYAEGYPDVSAEDKAELDTLLAAWIAKSCPPTFYEVKNVRAYIITEQDIASAQASTSGERQEGGAA